MSAFAPKSGHSSAPNWGWSQGVSEALRSYMDSSFAALRLAFGRLYRAAAGPKRAAPAAARPAINPRFPSALNTRCYIRDATMLRDPSLKYRPFPQIDLPNRQLAEPDYHKRPLGGSPPTCVTAIRPLADPMNAEEEAAVLRPASGRSAVKEIEVWFPLRQRDRVRFHKGARP